MSDAATGEVVAKAVVEAGKTFEITIEPGSYTVMALLSADEKCEPAQITVANGQKAFVRLVGGACDIP